MSFIDNFQAIAVAQNVPEWTRYPIVSLDIASVRDMNMNELRSLCKDSGVDYTGITTKDGLLAHVENERHSMSRRLGAQSKVLKKAIQRLGVDGKTPEDNGILWALQEVVKARTATKASGVSGALQGAAQRALTALGGKPDKGDK